MKALLPSLLGASAALLAPLGPIVSASPAGQAVVRAGAASPFAVDCEAPRSPNEVLVCADSGLRARDRALTLLAGASTAEGQWTRDVLDMCDSVACLISAYDSRISQLEAAGTGPTRSVT